MNTQFKRKEVTAKKEYHDQCCDHLDFGLIRIIDGKKTVDPKEAADLSMTAEDIAILQEAVNKNFRILPGEKHIYTSGIYEGDFYSVRFSIPVSNILTKYDLWYED